MKDQSAKLFYRKCLYGLAMDIGAKKEIFDKFNQSMLTNSLSAAIRATILGIIESRDAFNQEQRQISMLSVFDVLEKFNEYSISSNQYQVLEKILKSAGSSECSKLADNFMNEVKVEGDFPYETEKVKSKPLCIFIRNETLGQHWEGWKGLLGYTESQKYMETLRQRGIDVREMNNFLYENVWDGLREKLRSKEPVPYDDLLIIMIGYSCRNPISGMFMMNYIDKLMKKDIGCFDIIANLYSNLIKQFQGKKILLVSITLPVSDSYHDSKFTIFPKTNVTLNMPRNFAYLHLHAHDNMSMAELFKENFTDSWVNTTDMLRTLKQNSELINQQIDTISFDSNRLNILSEFQSDSVNKTQLEIEKMLIYKIRVNGCNLKNCKSFSKALGERSDSYHLIAMGFNFENGKIDEDSRNKLETKLLHDANSDKSYDFYTFVICCGEEVPNHFYQEVVQVCYSALDKAGQLSKPKLILIDAALETIHKFVAPTIHLETMIIICYTKPDKEEDSLIPVLTHNLKDDPNGNFDLGYHLVESIKDHKVKHASYYDSSIFRPVFLVSNPT